MNSPANQQTPLSSEYVKPAVNWDHGVPSIVGLHGLIMILLLEQHFNAILLGHAILYCQTLVGSAIVIITTFKLKIVLFDIIWGTWNW